MLSLSVGKTAAVLAGSEISKHLTHLTHSLSNSQNETVAALNTYKLATKYRKVMFEIKIGEYRLCVLSNPVAQDIERSKNGGKMWSVGLLIALLSMVMMAGLSWLYD